MSFPGGYPYPCSPPSLTVNYLQIKSFPFNSIDLSHSLLLSLFKVKDRPVALRCLSRQIVFAMFCKLWLGAVLAQRDPHLSCLFFVTCQVISIGVFFKSCGTSLEFLARATCTILVLLNMMHASIPVQEVVRLGSCC